MQAFFSVCIQIPYHLFTSRVMDPKHTYFNTVYPALQSSRIAYFSLEFGYSQSMHQYAGGLGILAGDHLKSSSDLGVPVIGVGLLYHEGSPHQHIDEQGNQVDSFTHIDRKDLPFHTVLDIDGQPLMIQVQFPEGTAHVRIHKVIHGDIALFLLDSYHEENAHDIGIMQITDRLYYGDREHRLRQEILLGIGGIKALMAMNLMPDFIHINEGHSAFALTEYIAQLMHETQQSFWKTHEAVVSQLLFTTHTPINAGNEVFSHALIAQYLSSHCNELSISLEEFLSLGMSDQSDSHVFSMSAFALNIAGSSNAVSSLHGVIARDMWKGIASKPHIASITNGIHTQTWMGEHIGQLLDATIGHHWREMPESEESWNGIQDLKKEDVFHAHDMQKQSMIAYIHSRLQRDANHTMLDPNGLYIGFARRFAMYKRAYLPFMDIQALKRVLNNEQGNVYLILAGKAHPDDHDAKAIIKHIHTMIHQYDLQTSVILLEDYDIALATQMIQGCDLWLNTPRRPLEASGTSGMKAALNGCLHCSISDGWWDEAYAPDRGFLIPHVQYPISPEEQDIIESNSLYDILTNHVIPTYFSRHAHEDWSSLMKNSIQKLGSTYSSHRMVHEYAKSYYMPGILQSKCKH